jgi:hypothetical protein
MSATQYDQHVLEWEWQRFYTTGLMTGCLVTKVEFNRGGVKLCAIRPEDYFIDPPDAIGYVSS